MSFNINSVSLQYKGEIKSAYRANDKTKLGEYEGKLFTSISSNLKKIGEKGPGEFKGLIDIFY